MKIIISGDLTKEEVFELLVKARSIERRNPKRLITILVDAQGADAREMTEVFRRVMRGSDYQLAVFERKGDARE